ncbi:hypothetical protein DCCM_4666 [Desulfocucumis palustris]|uniref:DUF86 domain-containing protein n=1 Tax=Desulfocucumis palustris TaxID=1898651 RepID=A0A2L2XGP8_9FIRM|nr:DUF86 domain-containing protein [Desulfocucumis palustris]GBF35537.1 hypothetical protein DCCM_4666 [Desulfocucumis palustris]
MVDDITINKSRTIERCLRRINEEYRNNPENLANITRQDSIILNIQRACEAAIDVAMHIVSERRLGIPQSSREVFDIICQAGLLDGEMAHRLKAMVGFRNIAVHDYQKINLNIVKEIIEHHLDDLTKFVEAVLKI